MNRLAVDWLESQWRDVLSLRAAGIPVHGFTWYSLTDQIDWQYALRIERNEVHTVGLFDLERRIRPVGEAYRRIIDQYSPLMTDEPFTPIARRA